MIRGAYHFATPDDSSGAAQANYFVDARRRLVGGRQDPAGRARHRVQPVRRDLLRPQPGRDGQLDPRFVNEYNARTSRYAVIYTTTDWWTSCTGNSAAFGQTNPLWVARYSSTPGTLPAGWPYYTFWQYSSTPIDQDRFSASSARLQVLADNA